MESKSYLLENEKIEWEKYCSRYQTGLPPNETKELDVEQFRAYMKYMELLATDDPSLASVQPGEFVVVHPAKGITFHGTLDDVLARDEDHEYSFHHKPGLEHLVSCKLVGSVATPGYCRMMPVQLNGHQNYFVGNLQLLVGLLF
jgi:hypothetical protein